MNNKLEYKENDLVFLSQFCFKSSKAKECWRGSTANAEKLCKAGDYPANHVIMELKEIENN